MQSIEKCDNVFPLFNFFFKQKMESFSHMVDVNVQMFDFVLDVGLFFLFNKNQQLLAHVLNGLNHEIEMKFESLFEKNVTSGNEQQQKTI